MLFGLTNRYCQYLLDEIISSQDSYLKNLLFSLDGFTETNHCIDSLKANLYQKQNHGQN